MEEVTTPEEGSDESRPLYSLVAGEGDGFMLGAAAGDTAGGAWELGYSAITEQLTVLSYHLIEHRRLDAPLLVGSLLELDGSEDGASVYRAPSPHFRRWLNQAASGRPQPTDTPSLDSAARAVPLGVAFRRDPEGVAEQTIELATLFDRDASSVAAAVVSAAAAAASCFGQSGRDLIAGVTETLSAASDQITRVTEGPHRLEEAVARLSGLMSAVGVRQGEEAWQVVGGDREDPLSLMMTGLLLVAPVSDVPHSPIEQAARVGGSILASVVGAIMGARVGIRAWPWAFANDTWFAEMGRRVVRGPDVIGDLPIPYAVEQHLMSGSRPGFH